MGLYWSQTKRHDFHTHKFPCILEHPRSIWVPASGNSHCGIYIVRRERRGTRIQRRRHRFGSIGKKKKVDRKCWRDCNYMNSVSYMIWAKSLITWHATASLPMILSSPNPLTTTSNSYVPSLSTFVYLIELHAMPLISCRILQAREEMCRERLRYLESMVTLFQFMQIVMIELVFRHSARVLNVSVHVGLFEL